MAVRGILVGIAVLAVLVCAAPSCSVLGASVDPLTSGNGTCPANGQPCGGVCVDITSNATSCGACGNACKQGEACIGGKCQVSCPGGQIACDGLCFATSNDPKHCGDCTTQCKAGEVCGDAHCGSTCPAGQTNCDGSCADLQTDAKHCGVCGTACGVNEECSEGKCVIACKTQLNQPITDPWGWVWDGLERAPSTFDDAKAACSAFRGRLPTASELYRVSAVQSATVGQSIHTNPLWTLAPVSPGFHVQLRLSDGGPVNGTDAAAAHYRCACPPVLPKVFVGANCYGAPNANGCSTLNDEGKRHNLDTKDRPPLPKSAAIWECSFNNAHLPPVTSLVEAIQQQNLGTGSDAWLHVGNEVRYDLGALVKWQGDGKSFLLQYTAGGPSSATWTQPINPAAFRCIGENFAPPALPAIPGEWAGSTRRKMEGTDLAAATHIQAVDACFKKGGHLPNLAELNELILQGLPGGSGTWLWTSDESGYDTNNFTVMVGKWKDAEPAHAYAQVLPIVQGSDSNMTWSYKTDSRPFRCLYYPIDTTYTGPPQASCAGGCTTIPMPGNIGGKMWFDNQERPAATLTAAIDSCRKIGGHLPSERDLIEGIRAGLPNGAGKPPDAALFILTSDILIGNCANNPNACTGCATNPASCGGFGVNMLTGVVQWTGTQPTFDDLWDNTNNSRMTWGWSFEPRPYRCMWTNELR